MEEKKIVIKDPRTFCFSFDWSKCIDDNLKYELEFIIKSNASLAKNKLKNENH